MITLLALSVLSCGMVPDAMVDNAPLLNACVAQAKATHQRTLYIPAGAYHFASRPAPFGWGVSLVGDNSVMGGAATQGNTLDVGGTALVRDYTETDDTKGFLTWDGSEAPTGGLGGGLKAMRILAGVGTTGGKAILITGTDYDHRTAWMVFEDIGVSRVGPGGSWFRDFEIDGSKLASVPGVRDVSLRNCYFFAATDPGKTVYLYNAMNTHWVGGGVFVPAGPMAGIYITGGSGYNEESYSARLSGVISVGPGSLTLDHTRLTSGDMTVVGGPVTVTSNSNDVMLAILAEGAVIVNQGVRSKIITQATP